MSSPARHLDRWGGAVSARAGGNQHGGGLYGWRINQLVYFREVDRRVAHVSHAVVQYLQRSSASQTRRSNATYTMTIAMSRDGCQH